MGKFFSINTGREVPARWRTTCTVGGVGAPEGRINTAKEREVVEEVELVIEVVVA